MASTREFACLARALKTARYLQEIAPYLMPEAEPAEGFGALIPLETLSALHHHGGYRSPGMGRNLHEAPGQIELPAISKRALGPLFNGTFLWTLHLAGPRQDRPDPLNARYGGLA